jgi:hypothetical protein
MNIRYRGYNWRALLWIIFIVELASASSTLRAFAQDGIAPANTNQSTVTGRSPDSDWLSHNESNGDQVLSFKGQDLLTLTPGGAIVLLNRPLVMAEDSVPYETSVAHVERRDGLVRVTTRQPHGFKVNDCVALTDTGNDQLDSPYTVSHLITSVPSPSSFVFPMAGSPATAERGSVLPAGFVDGLKIVVADGYRSPCNPAPMGRVALYSEIATGPDRKRIWGSNPLADVRSGFDGFAWGLEIDLNNSGSDQPGVGNDKPNTKYLVDAVSGGPAPVTVGFHTNVGPGAGNLHHGLWLSGILDHGIVIDDNTDACNLNPKECIGMPKAGLWYGRPSLTLTNRAFAVVRQWSNGDSGFVFQRNTDTTPEGNILEVRTVRGDTIAKWEVTGELTAPRLSSRALTTGTTSNTDLTGEIAFKHSRTAIYRFQSDGPDHPECIAQLQFDPGDGNRLWLTYDTDELIAHLTKESTGNMTYQCVARTR